MNRIRSGKQFLGFRRNHQYPSFAQIEIESQNKINEVRSKFSTEKSLYEEMSDSLKPDDSILLSGNDYRRIVLNTTHVFFFLMVVTIIFKEMTEPGGYWHHSESLRWIPFMQRQFECDEIIDKGLVENLKLKIRHFDDGVFDKKKL
ncbi:Oidioi.mRNA.OKI2018_I69.PAR.g11371.t1.cds [Oikopleura dioica]|uniref:Oidioi.mRNA.OKI2018_I69.PAR.g11371.t1.cds n=1 Tax=Oikopleura dioica TaxID=34765 RepID=A0ABN7S1N3_OIKDI|nr:Oidioi.mRNA.OKI2018_I69.PAR.g11371.t1.cds [Oikopleura dioica]